MPAQESDAPCRLFEEPHRRRAIEPFPVASAFAQDRPNQSERPIHSRVAASFGSFCFGDRIDQCPIDTLEFPIGQMAIEPTQLLFVVFDRGLIGLLAKPTNRRVLPGAPRPIPKLLQPLEFASQLIVQLLRLGFVAGLSRSSYSLTAWCGDVDPPDRPALSK